MANRSKVSRGGPQDDVFVEKNGNDVGAYTVEPLSGLMGLGAKDFVPPLAGGISYTVAQWLVNRFGGNLSPAIVRFSPVISGALGALLNSVALPFVIKKNGKKAVAQAAATSLTMGILTQVLQETGGLGAVVMERIAGGRSMGALPTVHGAGSMPRQIRQGIDRGVYGRTWS
ncbi:MAG: hypothetical protein ACYTBJ_00060 [Planctomycetota bacterium]|jgi:hypothetical protein